MKKKGVVNLGVDEGGAGTNFTIVLRKLENGDKECNMQFDFFGNILVLGKWVI